MTFIDFYFLASFHVLNCIPHLVRLIVFLLFFVNIKRFDPFDQYVAVLFPFK